MIRNTIPVLLLLGTSGISLAGEFYVSPSGSDRDPGSRDKPFATITRARDAVREAKQDAAESFTVYIGNGSYRLSETLVLGMEDSAPEGQTITYRSAPNEQPVLESGVRLEGWKKLRNPPDALPEIARDKVWVTDIPSDLRQFRTMYDGDKLLPRASKGFSPTADWKGQKGYPVVNENYDVLRELAFPKGALRSWPNLKDVEVAIRPHNAWVMNILGLESVDEQTSMAMTTIPGTYALHRLCGLKPGGISAWVENVLEALDSPGEWVVDTLENRVYLWPTEEEPGDSIFAPCLKELIRVEGAVDIQGPVDRPVRGLVFQGLTFSRADRGFWTEDDAGIQHDWEMLDKGDALLRFRGAEQCTVRNCRFLHSGGSALRLDLHCQNIRVDGNEIGDLGGGGILLIGYGPGTKDVNKNNTIINNHIYEIGRLYWHSHAIVVWQSGENRIADNYIHHCPRKAVCFSGVRPGFFWSGRKNRRECSRTIRRQEIGDVGPNWKEVLPFLHTRNNILEHNEVHHVLQMLGDGAAINVSGAGMGNVIRRNYVHDIENPHVASCIRTDDAQSGTLIEENIVLRSRAGGITPKRENHFVNNFLVDVGPGGDAIHTSGKWGPFGKSRIERNVFINTGERKRFWGGFRSPDIGKLSECRIDNNVYFLLQADSEEDTRGIEFLSALRKEGHDKGSHYGDPLFVDWRNGDFRFHDDSPALKLGIKSLDLSKVGLTKSFPERFRKSGE